jgi:hypothetical protein
MTQSSPAPEVEASDARPDPENPAVDEITPSSAPDSIDGPPPRTWLSRQQIKSIGGGVAVVAMGLYLLFQYRIWPGELPDAAAFFSGIGSSECLAHDLLDATCRYNGAPDGLTIAFGFPEVWLVALFRAVGLPLVTAFHLVWGLLLIGAFVGARYFFGVFVDRKWIAWGAAFLYLLSPIVSAAGGYGALQIGFALVPTYIMVDLWFMRAIDAWTWRAAVLGAAMVAVRVFAVLTDGYSFVMSLIPIGLAYLVWALRRGWRDGQWVRTVVGLGAAGVSLVIAYVIYSRFLGVGSFAGESVEFFRGQGVDLVAQAIPSKVIWFADLLGLHHNLAATQSYSDGPNVLYVYVGWGLVAAAVVGFVLVGRRRKSTATSSLLPIALAGLVGFVMALGPSLKINDFRPANAVVGLPTHADYTMQAGQATMSTGLAWFYRHIPGIDSMRALYRWELLPRLALLVLAAVGVAALLDRGRRVWAGALIALIVLEVVPSPVAAHRTGVAAAATVDKLTQDVIEPLRTELEPGERVLLVNPAAGGSGGNHYLANLICPDLQIECYNLGGDKAEALAAADRPKDVTEALASTKNLAGNVQSIFANDEADAIVLVKFDMRLNAYRWPATNKQKKAAQQAAEELIAATGVDAVDLGWATVIRPPGTG